jgi:tetratricopeptide (TPR) repeat protein
LAPNDAFAHLKLAEILVFAGRPQEALEFIDTAARLDPHGEARQEYIRGLAEFGLERFDTAAASLTKALELNPDFAEPTAVLVAAYGHQGQQDAVKLLEPYGYESWTGTVFNAGLQFPFQHETDRKRLEDGLRKAGMKDVY